MSASRLASALVLAPLTVLALACERQGTERDAPAADAQPPTADAATAGEPSAGGVAYRPPDGFPLPFAVELPPGTEPQPMLEDAAAGLRFLLPPPRPGAPRPYIHLYVFPPDAPQIAALEQARGFVLGLPPITGDDTQEVPADSLVPINWGIEQIGFSYTDPEPGGTVFVGIVVVGAHADRYFDLTLHGPAPLDAWWPAAQRVIQSWRWADGAPLTDAREPGLRPAAEAPVPR